MIVKFILTCVCQIYLSQYALVAPHNLSVTVGRQSGLVRASAEAPPCCLGERLQDTFLPFHARAQIVVPQEMY